MFVALYFLQHDVSGESKQPSRGFLIALSLAALIKVYAFIILFPAAYYYVFKEPNNTAKAKSIGLLAISSAIVVLWYLYARYLSEVHHNYDFRLESNFPYSLTLVPHATEKSIRPVAAGIVHQLPSVGFLLGRLLHP